MNWLKTIMSKRGHAFALAGAIIFAAATLAYSVAWMVDARSASAMAPVELGFDTDFIAGRQVQIVKSVYDASPAEKAGLRNGDEIIAIEGHSIDDAQYLNKVWSQHVPGDSIHLIVSRSEESSPIHLTGVFRVRQTSTDGGLAFVAGQVRSSFPVPFVVVGLVVLFLRLEDRTVWILALLFAGFAASPGFSNDLTFASALRPYAMGYKTILGVMLGPLFYFLFADFPVRSPIDRKLPWLKWTALVLGSTFTISGFRTGLFLLPPPLNEIVGQQLSGKIYSLFALFFIALGLLSLGTNFAAGESTEVRRKIRVIFWGSVVGMIPTLIRAGAEDFFNFRTSMWLETILTLLLFLFPLSIAYAVVKHRVLEIPVLLKRSARYVLVQRGFTLLLSVFSIAMVLLFALSLSNYIRSSLDMTSPFAIALGSVFGTVLLWGGTSVHRRVSGTIDRAFFRSAYDARVILENLAEKSAVAKDRRELAALLRENLTQALHTNSLYIYLKTNGTLEAVSGKVPKEIQSLSPDAPVFSRLAGGKPIEYMAGAKGKESGLSLLEPLKPECLIPMTGRGGRLSGLLVLGSRLSEEPYSGEDQRMLISVANQAATALENISLAEEITNRIETEQRVAREVEISRRILEADNERKTKELDEARALQLSMLPGAVPEIPGLAIAVYMKTATEVGGDYYDFAVARDGTLTVALGDATGHGAKAGTMVVAAKSLFNGFSDAPNLLEIFEKLTDSIKRLNMRSMYMSMLLLRIKNRTALVSSAGIPSPLIYRAAEQTVEEVTLKGMPLGAFHDFPYEERTIELRKGDAVILMTDGFPELFNPMKETFGYAHVKEIVARAGSRSPKEVIEEFLRAAEKWGNGTPQNDDMTFVVLKAV